MQGYSLGEKQKGLRVGLVPTMGYFHEGHLSLMRRARQECDRVVVSLFVNPLQFGPQEDFARYPRDLERDAALAEQVGVDVLFIPTTEAMYPSGYATHVEVVGLTEPLCGRSRPGHFRGVTTVVAKLFNIVQPDVAYFGQKDYQQALVISRMAADLFWPLKVVICPTVREPDGLAASSRNVYLNPEERAQANCLIRALEAAQKAIAGGERRAGEIERLMRETVGRYPLARVDYAEVRRARDLAEIEVLEEPVVLALAVWIGRTRLIDNALVEVGSHVAGNDEV
ncbi:MAG: pantoate--beta-alanine ligase [Clostridia bacterium]|jgi:pantoate--beta-alanine ligase|nr:pantoate--beta-alanine ligase [Clostridia bacterium]MDH7573344.1 pantoate--beta-alanine ligase [Clostridia bacterium]